MHTQPNYIDLARLPTDDTEVKIRNSLKQQKFEFEMREDEIESALSDNEILI